MVTVINRGPILNEYFAKLTIILTSIPIGLRLIYVYLALFIHSL